MALMASNTLFVVSAPSGSGKTSIMRKAMGQGCESLSFTTRVIREGEKHGEDYLFISKKRFFELDRLGEIAEKTQYPPNDPNGNFYGITLEELQNKLKKGNAFVIVDHVGMKQIKELYDNCVTIFIKCSYEDAIAHMHARGDSLASIQGRLATFKDELKNAVDYDYVVTNQTGKMSSAINVVQSIVKARGTTTFPQ